MLRYEEYDKRDTQGIDRYIDQISDRCKDTFYSIHENMYATWCTFTGEQDIQNIIIRQNMPKSKEMSKIYWVSPAL